MADRHGQGVGRVVRLRHLVEAEQQAHHLAHLVLLGAAVPDHRELDLGGRVLDHGIAALDGAEQRDAPGVPQFQGAPDVGGVKHVLHHDAIGPVREEQLTKAPVDREQLCRETPPRRES